MLVAVVMGVWLGQVGEVEHWLDRTRWAESTGRVEAIGDGGRSRGPYQIGEVTWLRFGGPKPWSRWAHEEWASRIIARRVIWACLRAARQRGMPLSYVSVRHLYRHGGF